MNWNDSNGEHYTRTTKNQFFIDWMNNTIPINCEIIEIGSATSPCYSRTTIKADWCDECRKEMMGLE